MCTYSQLKKNKKLCVTPQGVNDAPKVASGGLNIAKSIKGRSMKLTTLVDYMYMCAVTNAYLCNESIFYYYYFFKPFCFFLGGIQLKLNPFATA